MSLPVGRWVQKDGKGLFTALCSRCWRERETDPSYVVMGLIYEQAHANIVCKGCGRRKSTWL